MPGSKRDSNLDKAVDMTFPASDPPATGSATSTEPAKRPVDRKSRDRREKHHGLAEDGLHDSDKAEPTVVDGHAGLGKAGKGTSK